VRLVGGGGGVDLTSGSSTQLALAGGAGAYLEKTLTALTAGKTLQLTIGAGGSNSGATGGNTVLATGITGTTQTITTLTACGGGGATGASNNTSAFGAGGVAITVILIYQGEPASLLVAQMILHVLSTMLHLLAVPTHYLVSRLHFLLRVLLV